MILNWLKNQPIWTLLLVGILKILKTHSYLALNNNNQEVIIHSALGDLAAYGKIEIDIDEMGRKKTGTFYKNNFKKYLPTILHMAGPHFKIQPNSLFFPFPFDKTHVFYPGMKVLKKPPVSFPCKSAGHYFLYVQNPDAGIVLKQG